MVTARTDVRPVANVSVDVRTDAVDSEGAVAVGTGKELFADLQVRQVLRTVQQHQRTVAATPGKFVVSVHYRELARSLPLWALATTKSRCLSLWT